MRLPDAARRHVPDVVVGNDRGAHVARSVEHVQIEMGRNFLADLEAPHAVAVAVEPRREGAEAELGRQGGDDASADAALGRNADAIGPLAGIVVHARRRHHRQRAGNRVGCRHRLVGHRIDAAIGQRARHDSEIARRHEDRTLAEIDVEDVVDVALHYGVVVQQVTDGAVAVAGRALRLEHRFVDGQLASGEAAQRVEHAIEGAAALGVVDQARAGNRSGVDHRIERPIVGVEADRIERFTARLDADLGFDALLPEQLQRQREHESLRDRLDGEFDRGVAGLVDMAVDGREADTEMRRIGLAELRDVVGNRALVVAAIGVEAVFQEVAERRRWCRAGNRLADALCNLVHPPTPSRNATSRSFSLPDITQCRYAGFGPFAALRHCARADPTARSARRAAARFAASSSRQWSRR